MKFLCTLAFLAPLVACAAASPGASSLDPKGELHIPIGIPNTLDSLKTFVEAEGCFSPGFGTYGIYFWIWDAQQKKLFAPTMDGVTCEHGLADGGLLIPWSQWSAGSLEVRTELCEVQRPADSNLLCVVGARVRLTNRGATEATGSLYVALRPLGPAGGAVRSVGFSEIKETLAANGYPAVVAVERAQAIGCITNDTIGEWALRGELPPTKYATATNSRCSGALRYDLALPPGQSRTFDFTCPVFPNAWAVRHRWDGTNSWAQLDLNKPGMTNAGIFQTYPSLRFYRVAKTDGLFSDATNFWRAFTGRVSLRLPDPRWVECCAAMLSHSALCMNEDAPDVAVINYNVFNRDGAYMASIFEKTGHPELAEAALGYFLGHPFNGRAQPEADNPGQILWALAEHWLFTRDRAWLGRAFPSVEKLAAMIRYYRTTPGPHFVSDTSLEFGDALSPAQRKELKPGTCDGYHPEYTEAWDIAGVRGATTLADALGKPEAAAAWKKLADDLLGKYRERFGGDLAKGYGSYCVLWPCRLDAPGEMKAMETFKAVGAQKPADWRYFPLARAHQGLLAGNREAGADTLDMHLGHPQMRGWFAFDEGGESGVGGWNNSVTTWRHGRTSQAMPHGWATAEMLLLMRDSLVFEAGDKLVVFGGVPVEWFKHPAGMRLENLPTHFGKCSVNWTVTGTKATLALTGAAAPPGGFILRLPAAFAGKVVAEGKPIPSAAGECLLPTGTKAAEIEGL